MKKLVAVVSSGHRGQVQTQLYHVISALKTLVGRDWAEAYSVVSCSSPLSVIGQLCSLALIIVFSEQTKQHQEALEILAKYAREERIGFEVISVPAEADDTTILSAVRTGLHLDKCAAS